MDVSQGIILLLLIIISTFYPITALKCWDCKSSINPACGDPYLSRPFATMNCTASPRYAELKTQYPNMTIEMCRKVVENVDGKIHVIRSCGFLENPSEFGVEKCTKSAKSLGVIIESCSCYTDDCNGGFNISPSFMATVILSIGSLIITNGLL